MRTYTKTEIVNSYNQYLSRGKTIDLYVYTWSNLGCSNRQGNINNHKHQEDLVTIDGIKEFYNKFPFLNIKEIKIDDFSKFIENMDKNMLNIYNTPFKNHSKFTTSLPIQYKYQQAIRCFSKHSNIYGYSNVIITRPDICFTDYLPTLETKINNIYYKSICTSCIDHFWYGKPQTIINHLINIYDEYLQNYKEITSESHNNRDNNTILLYQCHRYNIKVNVIKQIINKIIYF